VSQVSEDDYAILHRQDPTLPKIRLFLLFMKEDNRIPEAIRWAISIDSKIRAMDVLFEEVLNQIPKCRMEFEEIKKKGLGSDTESHKLALKYEVFLNSIYSLCENISRVVAYLYHRKNLPQGFHDQKQKFLEDKSIDAHYTKILNSTQWYNEVRSMRDEATHYLSGLITISNPAGLGYFNRPKSSRNGTPESISIDDVEKHARQLYESVNAFLLAFGEHFIKIIDQEKRVRLPCILSSKSVGWVGISLKEYLNNESGICLSPDFNCPLAKSCKARKPDG
jgi:hypothetical protein